VQVAALLIENYRLHLNRQPLKWCGEQIVKIPYLRGEKMDWLKLLELLINLYIQSIHYLIWPVTVLILVFIFRQPIDIKLRELVKFKDWAEFAPPREMEKIKEKMSQSLNLSQINKETYIWENYLDALERWASWAGILISKSLPQKEAGWLISESDKNLIKVASKDFKAVFKVLKRERPKSELVNSLDKLFKVDESFCKEFNIEI
jgi:hypothetical protein